MEDYVAMLVEDANKLLQEITKKLGDEMAILLTNDHSLL
jgi:cell fate (sporulation/competence/biofilm development) regulator YmcA (YheA/YmcA/DUF963 family)